MSRLTFPVVLVVWVFASWALAVPAWGQLQLPDNLYDITDDTPSEPNDEGTGAICDSGGSGDMDTYLCGQDRLTWNATLSEYALTDGATGEPVGTARVTGQDAEGKWVVELYDLNGGLVATQYWKGW